MASKTLPELLKDVQAIGREREALHLKAKKLWETIDPLLVAAEAERRANPSPEGEAQGIGIEEILDPNDV